VYSGKRGGVGVHHLLPTERDDEIPKRFRREGGGEGIGVRGSKGNCNRKRLQEPKQRYPLSALRLAVPIIHAFRKRGEKEGDKDGLRRRFHGKKKGRLLMTVKKSRFVGKLRKPAGGRKRTVLHKMMSTNSQ